MKRSTHDLSYTHNLSLDMGTLVPLGAVDVLPGDSFRSRLSALVRVAPLAKPVMHPVDIRVHNWFVPNRLIWEDWEDFIVGNEGGKTYPTITPATAAETVLYDHMGVEPVTGVAFDALPIRAYNFIWNEFYRDQDLAAERGLSIAEGADSTTDTDLARIAWGKDYFTTARANAQQGSSVEVGFSAGSIPVSGIGIRNHGASAFYTNNKTSMDTSVGMTGWRSDASPGASGEAEVIIEEGTTSYPDVRVDLSNASGGIDINDLRNAISLQRIAEAREFFGSRYQDYLRWYGVNPRDGRLSRPEYLGGGRQTISFSEVLSTAEGATVGVGELFGHGIAGLRQRPFRKMFEEHGWFISLMSVRPRGIYQNGIPRRFMRRDPTDFWHRELELLPWQSIPETEVYGAGSASTIFGCTPRS